VSVGYERLLDVVDEHTLDIVERRRSGSGVHRRGWLMRRALVTADLVALTLSFVFAEALFEGHRGNAGRLTPSREYLLFILLIPAWVVAAKLYGLYDKDEERTDHSTTDDFSGVFHLITVTTWLLFAVGYFMPVIQPRFPKLFTFWALAVVSIPLARAFARTYCRRQIHYLQNTLIVGAGVVGQSLARRLMKHPEYGLNLVGFVDHEPMERGEGLEHLSVLGDPEDISEIVELLDVERVIFAFSTDRDANLLELARELNPRVQVDVVPRLFEVISPAVGIHTVEGLPFLGVPPFRMSRSSMAIKRAMDIVGASIGLLVLSPLLVVVAIMVKLDAPGPIFFRQDRMGRHDVPFSILKFRTMVDAADQMNADYAHLNKHAGGDERMFKIEDDPRTTRSGRWLRRTSIDELPQLWNVLRGDMSLVGPRPLVLDEHLHVSDWAERRLDLRPGMTGLWQVLGRDDIPFGEMVKLDYLYVTNWSLATDIGLIFKTIPLVVRPIHRGGQRAYVAQ
jgi:exopolysaccharide biosynthesis polyprenyl glycosylphosphotransferase